VVDKTDYVDSYRDNFPVGDPNAPLLPPAQAMLEYNVVDGNVAVPPGYYFAMGDNRDQSSDSRCWGFAPRENIIGKPLVIYWSYDATTDELSGPAPTVSHLFDIATHFTARTRWNRTLHLIRAYPVQ
jgi:signal peptidase I